MQNFYKNKSIFITGHTGFKGSWLCKVLSNMGARVTGYSLEPPTEPSLFKIAGLEKDVKSICGDIRDFDSLWKAFDEAKPEIVIHMAAQPIVRDSYKLPAYTYETNVMGTVNILECVRLMNLKQEKCGAEKASEDGAETVFKNCSGTASQATSGCADASENDSAQGYKGVRSFLNVTTDKVYLNHELDRGFVETDELDGYDPYSNSKSCSELVTHSYARSFFNADTSDNDRLIPSISTARAGNVIGGGDFANDRIIPDCVRAAMKGEDIIIRNPYSIRPYQHVLEPLFAYLMIAQAQYAAPELAGWYNVGPDEADCVTTGALAEMFVKAWGNGLKWIDRSDNGPHEAGFLKLDCTKLKNTFGWKPCWSISDAIEKSTEWYKTWQAGGDVRVCMDEQISQFMTARDGRIKSI